MHLLSGSTGSTCPLLSVWVSERGSVPLHLHQSCRDPSLVMKSSRAPRRMSGPRLPWWSIGVFRRRTRSPPHQPGLHGGEFPVPAQLRRPGGRSGAPKGSSLRYIYLCFPVSFRAAQFWLCPADNAATWPPCRAPRVSTTLVGWSSKNDLVLEVAVPRSGNPSGFPSRPPSRSPTPPPQINIWAFHRAFVFCQATQLGSA